MSTDYLTALAEQIKLNERAAVTLAAIGAADAALAFQAQADEYRLELAGVTIDTGWSEGS